MLTDAAASYTPDIAAEIDKPEEIIADEIGISLAQARQVLALIQQESRTNQSAVLAQVIGHLLAATNMPARVYALALAFGLDTLNGFHSQAEVARRLGCTRALISHYVVAWRDVLAGEQGHFDCVKFRKHNHTRATYATNATSATLTAKRQRHDRKHN